MSTEDSKGSGRKGICGYNLIRLVVYDELTEGIHPVSFKKENPLNVRLSSPFFIVICIHLICHPIYHSRCLYMSYYYP